MQKVKAVTLLEIIIVVVVIGILATVALPTYTNTIENARAEACAANESALKAALNIYVLDNDTMPGDLSQLPQKYIDQAYASLLRAKNGWRIKLAKALINFDDRGRVYAGLKTELSKGNSSVLHCPSAAPGAISYGLNNDIAGISTKDFRGQLDDTEYVIADCDAHGFNDPSEFSHRHKKVSLIAGTDTFTNAVQSVDPAGVVTVVRVPGPHYSATYSTSQAQEQAAQKQAKKEKAGKEKEEKKKRKESEKIERERKDNEKKDKERLEKERKEKL